MKKLQIASLAILAVAIVSFCLLEAGTLSSLQSGLLAILSPITRSGGAVKKSISGIG